MSNPDPQPTEEQELANAAYNWRKKVQADMVSVFHNQRIRSLEEAEWWFERYRRAYRREMETEAAAKAAKGAS